MRSADSVLHGIIATRQASAKVRRVGPGKCKGWGTLGVKGETGEGRNEGKKEPNAKILTSPSLRKLYKTEKICDRPTALARVISSLLPQSCLRLCLSWWIICI